MNETSKPRLFYGYVVVLAGFFIGAATSVSFSFFAIFLKPLLTEFGWTRGMTSGASSLFLWVSTLFGIGGGRLADKFGPRPVLTACGLLIGLGFFLMSRINAIWHLYLAYGVILAIAMSAQWVPLVSIVPRWFVKRRAMMQGIMFSGAGLGAIIMPPLAARLIITYGWRTSLQIIGAIALVLVILAAQFLRRDPAQIGQLPYGEDEVKQQNLNLEAGGFSLRQAIHTRQFWLFCAVYGCLWFSTMAISVHIVIHAIDLGISAISAAYIPAIRGVVSIAGRILIGSSADRIGHKPALLLGFALMSVSLVWLLVAKELWALYLFVIIFGFGVSGLVVLESPLMAKLFGLGSLGVILGSAEFVSVIFGATSPTIAGYIFDIKGSYQLAFSICAAVSILGLMLTLLLKLISGKGGINDTR